MTKKQSNFAENFAELENLTQWFETEEVDVEEGIKKFERGLELASLCKARLAEVENKVTELKKKYQQLIEE
ncbi:MAG: exodeoxyribonuclease VII small subunit [Patescibacteria group bacterium]|jgi:exodeoxyribonuclease VII small subunit